MTRKKVYTVGEVAEIAKVTVRTLHHYDAIGLLTPSGRSRAGYRLYTDADLERLQQIRLHRELGMALEEVRRVLDDPHFDPHAALRRHRERLVERTRELEKLIATIDEMLAESEGGKKMTNEDRFEGFRHEEYRSEARERWGDTPEWKQAQQRVANYGDEDWGRIKAEAASIVEELAKLKAEGKKADSRDAMAAAERHRIHLDRWYYACSPTMHAALSDMYVSDPRFAQYFDKHGEGLSAYVAAAIRANAELSWPEEAEGEE
jgi:DNA-binding transcriptional MerR regulator